MKGRDKVVFFTGESGNTEYRVIEHPAHLKNILFKHYADRDEIEEAVDLGEIQIFELKELPVIFDTRPVLKFGEDSVEM